MTEEKEGGGREDGVFVGEGGCVFCNALEGGRHTENGLAPSGKRLSVKRRNKRHGERETSGSVSKGEKPEP